MKLAIVGQGAIASLYAHYWRNVHPTILVRTLPALPKTLMLLNDSNVTLDLPFQDINHPPMQDFDALLICVKCYQIEGLVNNIKPWLQASTKLVLVQNGMGGAQQLSMAFPANSLFVGTCTDGIFSLSKNWYQQTAQGKLDIGAYNNSNMNKQNTSFLRAFSSYHPNATIHDDISLALYRKLAVNAVINPLTAVYKIKNGELLNFKHELDSLKQEVFSIFSAMNIDWQHLKFTETIDEVINLTASNYSSMQQDVQHNRKTEIDGVLGFLIEMGTKKGVKTPLIVSLYSTIKSYEDE